MFLSAILMLALPGCYTQFAALDRYGDRTPARAQAEDDSAADTISAAPRVDTVRVRERETCYWQRDFFGRPRLRCYRSYYDDDWYDFYYRPWWYSPSSRYYGSDCDCYCPYLYSYHDGYCTDCVYCRDYCYWYCRSYHYSGGRYYGSGGGGTTTVPNSPPRRPSVRSVVPQSSAAGHSSPATSTATAPAEQQPVHIVPDSAKLRQSGASEPKQIRRSVRPGVASPDETPVRTLEPGKTDVSPAVPQEKAGVAPMSAPEHTPRDSMENSGPSSKRRRSVRQW